MTKKIKIDDTDVPKKWSFKAFNDWFSKYKDVLIVVGTWVMALASILLFLQSIYSSHNDKRAWVGPNSYNLNAKEGDMLTCWVGYINTGKTPALDVKIRAALHYVPGNETKNMNEIWKELNLPPSHISNVALPDIQYHIPFIREGMKVSLEESNAINQQKQNIYILGEIKYHDIYREEHITKFCVHLTPVIGKGTFEPCAEHNTAT